MRHLGGLRQREAWFAVDRQGCDLATGRPPEGDGAPSAAAALASAPVVTWPVVAASSDGRTLSVAEALGRGGGRVAVLLERLASDASPPGDLAVDGLTRATPAGDVDLPVTAAGLAEAVRAADEVDQDWMAEVERRRPVPRSMLGVAGRTAQLEAALNLAMLLGTGPVPDHDGDGDARVASGARLWLLGAGVSWALTERGDDPFAAWTELVSYGIWPVGPASGRLVVWPGSDGSAGG